MNKVVTLTGGKYAGQLTLAYKLGANSDAEFVKPYTDREVPIGVDPDTIGDYHFVSKDVLDKMIDEEEVLCSTEINNARYVIFIKQLVNDYNILVVDDYQLLDVKRRWSNLFTVKVHGRNEESSDRVDVCFRDDEFDEVFMFGVDDFDILEARII